MILAEEYRRKLMMQKINDVDCGYAIITVNNLEFEGTLTIVRGAFNINKISAIYINDVQVPITPTLTLTPASYTIRIHYKNLYDCEDMFDDFGIHGTGVTGTTTIDVSNLDISHSSSMKRMFGTNIYTILGLETLNTSNIKDMNLAIRMVQIYTYDLRSWDVSKVKTLSHFFRLEGVRPYMREHIVMMQGWDVRQVKNVSYLLGSIHVKEIDLTGWDLSNVEDMSNMFDDNIYLEKVIMDGPVNPSAIVTNMFGDNNKIGTFYYNPAYDYSHIIAQLPSTWTAVEIETNN